MKPLSLLKDLVAIPSYKDAKTDERKIADFIFEYLKTNTKFTLKKQPVSNGRYNIFATTKKPTMLVAAHMDTVQPKQGWKSSQFRIKQSGKQLAGLGAVDTKGGIASLLSVASELSTIPGVALLFYCDEEYDFLGMKTFLRKQKTRPKVALVLEPTGLKISNAHRGLIECSWSIQGKTGHAAFGKDTVNAIDVMNQTLLELREYISTCSSQELGASRMNVAFIRGGLLLANQDKKKKLLGREGNNVADYAEVVVDIRTSTPELDARRVQAFVKKRLARLGASMVEWNVRHDLGALITRKSDLQKVERAISNIVNPSYIDPQHKGYSDGQLIQAAWGIPVFYLGPTGGNAHAANEWVDATSLDTLAELFLELARTLC